MVIVNIICNICLQKEDLAYQHQFILHAALDVVQDLAWTTNAMFLRSVDRFNDLVVSVYVTAGHTRFMLLHDSRSDDGIKTFFQEVHDLYIKVKNQLVIFIVFIFFPMFTSIVFLPYVYLSFNYVSCHNWQPFQKHFFY
jgi:hypothetical protein